MRFEVIDHRKNANPLGRAFYAEGEVELSYQDGGNTLKVFLRDAPEVIELTPIDPSVMEALRAKQDAAMAELAALDQELGLYDTNEYNPLVRRN